MKIHNGGLVQIGATGGGGYAIEGISSVGSGLAVVDYTGSTGNSGDVLVNVDNTGLTRWAPSVGDYGKTVVDAVSSSFFYNASSGGSAIAVSKALIAGGERWYYQASQGKPIWVTLAYQVSINVSGTVGLQNVTYYDSAGTSVTLAPIASYGAHNHFQLSFPMYPGSSFEFPNISGIIAANIQTLNCVVFKQE